MKRLIALVIFGAGVAAGVAAQDIKWGKDKAQVLIPVMGGSWVSPLQTPGEKATFDEDGRLVFSLNYQEITLQLGHGARLCGDITIWQGDIRYDSEHLRPMLYVNGPATVCPIERK